MKIVDYQRPPIKVAIMGLGRSVFETHYPVFKAHPSLFKVVATCDILKDRRDIVARDYPECRMFRQYDDMLDERDIDLVDIATTNVDHVEHAVKSLKRGYWTLLETPVALTYEDAQILKGAAMKAKNRLMVMQRGMFDPDFMLAKKMMEDPRLGMINEIRIRKEDYIRRDDWWCVKRLGGGAAYYAMPDLLAQALELMPVPPIQMWSHMVRIASLGDCEDCVHVNFKTRTNLAADIEYNGGCLPQDRGPSFEIRGELGTFKVMPGASEGTLSMVDPNFHFPRRRMSVRTPPFGDLHENFPTVTETVKLPPGTLSGQTLFWKHVYDTVRTATPFPFKLDGAIESIKYIQLMKKNSPFG